MGYMIPRLVISLSKKQKHFSPIKKMPRCRLKEVQYLKIAFFHNMEIFWEMV
jgi:hypothetical protein